MISSWSGVSTTFSMRPCAPQPRTSPASRRRIARRWSACTATRRRTPPDRVSAQSAGPADECCFDPQADADYCKHDRDTDGPFVAAVVTEHDYKDRRKAEKVAHDHVRTRWAADLADLVHLSLLVGRLTSVTKAAAYVNRRTGFRARVCPRGRIAAG